jgi:Rieske Fe-S protein
VRSRDREQITIPPDGRPYDEQPKWRRDFPIDWPQDDYVARRDFAKFLVLTSFAFTFGQFWIVMKNFVRRRAGRLPIREVASVESVGVGESLVFDYPHPHDNCLLMRTSESEFVAYSQKCTHLSCPVTPSFDLSRLTCPCHKGSFDVASGMPTGGPPRRPLPLVDLEIRNGRVYATGIRERTA